jgi:phosphatidylglycerophosphate synthase
MFEKKHTQYIKKLYRIIGDLLAPYIKTCGISANQITISRILFVFMGSIFILFDNIIYKLITLFCFIIFSLFDATDGSLARITKKSLLGMWLDTLIDRIGLLLIFLFLGIKLIEIFENNIFYFITNFLILIFYFIKYSILTDISVKEKYLAFRQFDNTFSANDNSILTKEFVEKYSLKYLLSNLTLKNFFKFFHHQFSPHTANLIFYVSIINLFSIYKIGLVILFFYFIIWLTIDVYKVTKTAINIDNNK